MHLLFSNPDILQKEAIDSAASAPPIPHDNQKGILAVGSPFRPILQPDFNISIAAETKKSVRRPEIESNKTINNGYESDWNERAVYDIIVHEDPQDSDEEDRTEFKNNNQFLVETRLQRAHILVLAGATGQPEGLSWFNLILMGAFNHRMIHYNNRKYSDKEERTEAQKRQSIFGGNTAATRKKFGARGSDRST